MPDSKMTGEEKMNALTEMASEILSRVRPQLSFKNGYVNIELQVGEKNEPGTLSGSFTFDLLECLVAIKKYYNTFIPDGVSIVPPNTGMESMIEWLEKRAKARKDVPVVDPTMPTATPGPVVPTPVKVVAPTPLPVKKV